VSRAVSLEALLLRDRVIVGWTLAVVVILSWTYIFLGGGMGTPALQMSGLPTAPHMNDPMAAMQPSPWTAGYAALLFVMWWLMMLATMLPSASPMILLYAALSRTQQASRVPYFGTGLFSFGYLAVWAAFSALAVALQWQLARLALLSPMMVATSVTLGACLLIGAGIWQFTPLKHACLRHCRAPAEFLSRYWRPGQAGAVHMGMLHGAYCLGCCWMLMLLLFYGGIMNLYWIAGLATLVLVEKIAPMGMRISGVVGAVLIIWGGALLVHVRL
jgi:predicted metal-binding membrane protein